LQSVSRPWNSSALNWMIIAVLERYNKMAAQDKSAPSRHPRSSTGANTQKAAFRQAKYQGQ
jgi:hypothetical protein